MKLNYKKITKDGKSKMQYKLSIYDYEIHIDAFLDSRLKANYAVFKDNTCIELGTDSWLGVAKHLLKSAKTGFKS